LGGRGCQARKGLGGVDASFCRFQQRAEIVNRRTRVFCGRLRLRGFLEE
jgi:hypothetical protein